MARKGKGVQLRLTRPEKRARTKYLTQRQQSLLALLRFYEGPVDVALIGRLMKYRDPRGACERLVRRGLAVKVEAGWYRARALRERKA